MTAEKLRKILPRAYKTYNFFKTEYDAVDDPAEKCVQILVGTAATIAVFAVEVAIFKVPSLIPKILKYIP